MNIAPEYIDGLLRYINETADLLSLLYDLNMMPEQLERGSIQWRQMLVLADWHRARFTKLSPTPTAATEKG